MKNMREARQVPYEEIIHVPLIISHPDIKQKGKVISTLVQLIDLLPTILDFLGVSSKKDAQGVSLVPLMEGREGNFLNRLTYTTGCHPRSKSMRECSYTVRALEWKLIKRIVKSFIPSPELYDIKKDPKELDNQFHKEKSIGNQFIEELKKYLRKG